MLTSLSESIRLRMLTRDNVFGYSGELVKLWQYASPVLRGKPEKVTVIKKVTQHGGTLSVQHRQLAEGGKVAGEDWQAVVTRLHTLVTRATEYVPIISTLTPPKLEEIQTQSSSQAGVPAYSAPRMLGQKRARERSVQIVGDFNLKDVKKIRQGCGEECLFSADQQRRYKQLRNEDP